jgi:hypothetical protein
VGFVFGLPTFKTYDFYTKNETLLAEGNNESINRQLIIYLSSINYWRKNSPFIMTLFFIPPLKISLSMGYIAKITRKYC